MDNRFELIRAKVENSKSCNFSKFYENHFRANIMFFGVALMTQVALRTLFGTAFPEAA